MFRPFGVGGWRISAGGSYSKEFKNATRLAVDGSINYGIYNKDVRGNLGIEYTYLPKRFGSFKLRGGDDYDFVTMQQSITNFLSQGNFVRKRFLGFSKRMELVNGLYGRFSYDYSIRTSIADLERAPYLDTLGALLNWQPPQPYETYTVSIFSLELLYRFKQKYMIKGGKKIIIGTEYPQLRLTYKMGIPDMFGSDVNFDYIEIGASDEITFGTFGNMKWDFEMGYLFR